MTGRSLSEARMTLPKAFSEEVLLTALLSDEGIPDDLTFHENLFRNHDLATEDGKKSLDDTTNENEVEQIGSEEKQSESLTSLNQEEKEKPTSTARLKQIENNLVEEEQCRVCTSKEELVSLFKKIEQQTIAEMLMSICPSVKIALKDLMPQFICNLCLDNVTIAVQLKNQCEKTEAELRKRLLRSKNKVKRPSNYVVIDVSIESDDGSPQEKESKDEEFKVSASDVSLDDSDDSDYGVRKRKPRPAKTKRRRKSANSPLKTIKALSGAKSAPEHSSEEDPIIIDNGSINSIDRLSQELSSKEFPCPNCTKVFNRNAYLQKHLRVHARQSFDCNKCGKKFKLKGALQAHMQRHKSAQYSCPKCPFVFISNADLRYHLAEEHKETLTFECSKCKKSFSKKSSLEQHQASRCPGHIDLNMLKKDELQGLSIGQDLFKTVAPLTTTHWSDSFSD